MQFFFYLTEKISRIFFKKKKVFFLTFFIDLFDDFFSRKKSQKNQVFLLKNRSEKNIDDFLCSSTGSEESFGCGFREFPIT